MPHYLPHFPWSWSGHPRTPTEYGLPWIRSASHAIFCFGSRRSRVRFSPPRPLHPHLIWPVSSNFLHCFRSYGQQITSLWLEQVHIFQSGIPPADSHTSNSLLRPIKFRIDALSGLSRVFASAEEPPIGRLAVILCCLIIVEVLNV